MLVSGLASLGACRGTGPALFYEHVGYAAAQDMGAVWFFPAVDETGGWDESRVDRVRCPAAAPQYWCAPTEVLPNHPPPQSPYGGTWNGPFGAAITGKLPQKSFGLTVRNQSYSFMGIFGTDCPPGQRTFPVETQSFTVVVVDSRAYTVELFQPRYCPSIAILGAVSHAPGRENARRAIEIVTADGSHPSMRIAALEALARSPEGGRCREVHDLVRRIQEGDPSRRVRDYALERWSGDRLERARSSGGVCGLGG
jgi:hypothetical protein